MTPQRVEQHTIAKDLGWGQTWQNVSGSRTINTSYQNTTSRPIQVNVIYTSSQMDFQVSADNSTWVNVGSMNSSANAYSPPATATIPANWYYRLSNIGGLTTGTQRLWAELR
jgi:hypothetical protein